MPDLIDRATLDGLRVEPGARADLDRRPTRWKATGAAGELCKTELGERARALLADGVAELAEAQELLWASDTKALLVVFQAMDAAGKDSTIEHVMSGVNPQGVSVVSFKQPSSEDLDHTFLWRVAKAAPERGRIGIFNRSHYEEVLVVRVHPELLDRQQLPPGKRGKRFWRERYDDINAFEHHLARNGTHIVKFFLHVSKQEQRERFLARLDEPEKTWKFSAADVAERAFWDEYQRAYEEAISATSTSCAPWYVIPADQKPVMRAMVAQVLVRTIRDMDLRWPEVTEADRAANAEARRALLAE